MFEQAKGFVDARFKGKQTLRGIHDPVELFELRSALFRTRWQVRAERGLSALMGRTTEWAFLKGTYDREADHRGTVIAVVGAPGVGKSRLVHDFIRLTVGGDWVVLEAACASQRMTSSYDAISMLVRAWFKIASGDTPEAVVQRVDAKIAEIDASLLPYVPAILSLLDVKSEEPNWQTLDPVQRRQKVGEAVRALILAQARASPLLILVEDVHWADTETMLVLDRLAATLGDTRILIITTSRPESRATVASSPDQSRLALSPLDAAASEQLLDWLVGDEIGLTQLKRRILERAQGNPLFLEELVRSLNEANVLEGARGRYLVAKPAEAIEIPQTIQSVLAARIDLLDGLPKTVLQTAAIIGKDIPVDLLSRMADIQVPQLSEQLEQLEAADFIYRTTIAAGAEYFFKHELTREVAYNSILIARRRMLHARALQVIEANFAKWPG